MKRNNMKNVGLIIIALSILMLTAGCGGSQQTSSGEQSQADQKGAIKRITVGTAEVGGGALYSVGSAIAKVVTDKVPNYEMMPEATGASVENLKLIQAEQTEFGFSGSDIVYYAMNGTAPFTEKLDKINSVCYCWAVPNKLVTLKSSDIKSYSDLKGKVVQLGGPGSGTLTYTRNILKALDLENEVKGQTLGMGEVMDSMKDGHINAFFFTGADPMAQMNELAQTHELYIVPMTEEEIKRVCDAYSEYKPYVLKAGTYPWQTEDVPMTTTSHQIFAGTWASEETVYQVTKAIFENLEELGKAHPQGKNMSLDNALKDMVAPLHPGAQKYYQEVNAPGIENF